MFAWVAPRPSPGPAARAPAAQEQAYRLLHIVCRDADCGSCFGHADSTPAGLRKVGASSTSTPFDGLMVLYAGE